MSDDANTLPVLVVPMKIDADVVASVTLWLLLNYDSPEQAREVLAKAEIYVVGLQYQYAIDAGRKLIWQDRQVLVFDVGGAYLPGVVYDHHLPGGARSATRLVWEEFQAKVPNETEKNIYHQLVEFIDEVDDHQSFFAGGQILLERIVQLLKLNNVSVLNNSAFGPSFLPNALGKMLKTYPQKLSDEQVREVLLKGFDLIVGWKKEETILAKLLQDQEVKHISDLVDIVSVTTTLIPERLRHLYNRAYRFRLRKFYILVSIVEYPRHRQLVVQNMIPGTLARVDLVYLANWLSQTFKIQYAEINLLKNNNILTVCLPRNLENFHIQQVAGYLERWIRCYEDQRLALLTKLFTKVFAFVDFHNDNPVLLSETFTVLWRMLRLVQTVDDLKPFITTLEEMEKTAQIRSDSYPELLATTGLDKLTEQVEASEGREDRDSKSWQAVVGEMETGVDECELQGVFQSRNKKTR